jgi:hypothetical protein
MVVEATFTGRLSFNLKARGSSDLLAQDEEFRNTYGDKTTIRWPCGLPFPGRYYFVYFLKSEFSSLTQICHYSRESLRAPPFQSEKLLEHVQILANGRQRDEELER